MATSPSLEGVVRTMQAKGMLPAIWFIFSRKECDASAQAIVTLDLHLTTAEERGLIQAEVEALRAEQPEAVREGAVAALLRGAAAHHAGLLPGYKLLIEKLFQKGINSCVFECCNG